MTGTKGYVVGLAASLMLVAGCGTSTQDAAKPETSASASAAAKPEASAPPTSSVAAPTPTPSPMVPLVSLNTSCTLLFTSRPTPVKAVINYIKVGNVTSDLANARIDDMLDTITQIEQSAQPELAAQLGAFVTETRSIESGAKTDLSAWKAAGIEASNICANAL